MRSEVTVSGTSLKAIVRAYLSATDVDVVCVALDCEGGEPTDVASRPFVVALGPGVGENEEREVAGLMMVVA